MRKRWDVLGPGAKLRFAMLAALLVAGSAWLTLNQRPSLQAASIMSEVIPAGTRRAADFLLRDQNGQVMSLQGEHGRVIALTFLNSHCTDLCPIEADQLSTAERQLNHTAANVLMIVSVAPETDTPASVRAFARDHHWTGEWHWALGTRAQMAPVWAAYGVQSVPAPTANNPNNVAHSGALYLIDPAGYERVGFGLNFPSDVIARDIRALSPGGGWAWPWSR